MELIKLKESDYEKVMNDNGITTQNLEDIVIDYMTIKNPEEFFNTTVAYDVGGYDAGDSSSIGLVKERVREFVDNFIIPEIGNYDSEYDFDDWINGELDNNEELHDELLNIDSEFQEYGDKQMDIWRDDQRDLERQYNNDRL